MCVWNMLVSEMNGIWCVAEAKSSWQNQCSPHTVTPSPALPSPPFLPPNAYPSQNPGPIIQFFFFTTPRHHDLFRIPFNQPMLNPGSFPQILDIFSLSLPPYVFALFSFLFYFFNTQSPPTSIDRDSVNIPG